MGYTLMSSFFSLNRSGANWLLIFGAVPLCFLSFIHLLINLFIYSFICCLLTFTFMAFGRCDALIQSDLHLSHLRN